MLRQSAFVLALLASSLWPASSHAQSGAPALEQEIRQRAAEIENKLIAWRRDIHENPSSANRKHAPQASSQIT